MKQSGRSISSLLNLHIARPIFTIILLAPFIQSVEDAGSIWPGQQEVDDACKKDSFGENLSGIYLYENARQAWAIQNTGFLYKLYFIDGDWIPDTLDEWGTGKQILYPDGSGVPDAEDITMAHGMSDSVYVCTERNDTGSDSKVSRMSVLRYNVLDTGEATALPAVNEWDLTQALPEVKPNLGLEAITWIPDSYLTKYGFIDESTNSPYEPDMYPGHGEGLFFVGLESNAKVYAFALDHINDNNSSLVTDFKTELLSIMSLYFDGENEYLWTLCDDTCDGKQEVYSLGNNNGKFDSMGVFNRPEGMPNINNEGFAVSPESLCDKNNLKPVFWVDDSYFESYAIRSGTVECGDFLEIQ